MPKSPFVDFKAVKAAITMEQVLEHYGILDKFKRGADSFSGPCPIHKGSNPTQFRVSISKNIWNCFSKCSCGGNTLDFIAKMEDVSIHAAALKAIEWFSLDLDTVSADKDETVSAEEKTPAPKPAPKPVTRTATSASPVEKAASNAPLKFRLDKLDRKYPYLLERGLSDETIIDFGIGYFAWMTYSSVGTVRLVAVRLCSVVENSRPVTVMVDAGGLAWSERVPTHRFNWICPNSIGPYHAKNSRVTGSALGWRTVKTCFPNEIFVPLIRAKLGKSINGKAPYGFKWVNRELAQHPDEAPIRRKAYELFLQYRRKGMVAKLLNSEGLRSRAGAKFSDMQVGRILTCSSAKGIYYFNRVRKTGPWKETEKPEAEWGKAACPPIVSEEVWNQVNQIIEEQGKKYKRPGKVPVNPFGNRIWCQCGQRMYERKHIGKFFCRGCKRKIPVTGFEEFIRKELHRFYGSPQQVALRQEDAKKNLIETEEALTSLQRQIQKVRDEMNKTHKLYLEGGISIQGFRQFYDPAEERLGQLLAGLPKLEASVAVMKVDQVSLEEVVHEARTLYEQWPQLDTDRKRVIIETVFERIEVKDGENGGTKIAITYSGLPSSEELCKSQQRMAPALC